LERDGSFSVRKASHEIIPRARKLAEYSGMASCTKAHDAYIKEKLERYSCKRLCLCCFHLSDSIQGFMDGFFYALHQFYIAYPWLCWRININAIDHMKAEAKGI